MGFRGDVTQSGAIKEGIRTGGLGDEAYRRDREEQKREGEN